jgi:hypothetical protein
MRYFLAKKKGESHVKHFSTIGEVSKWVNFQIPSRDDWARPQDSIHLRR